MTDSTTNEDTADANADGVSRRTLIRLLVGGGIGIPLAIEARTLYGLVTGTLLGEDTEDGGTARDAAAADRVGIGEELLPATAPAETVTEAHVTAGDGWTFTLAVRVENGTGTPYELRIRAVETDGERIAGVATTGRVPPGESRTLTGQWQVPEGSVPSAVEAVGVTAPDDGGERVVETVPLEDVPVRRTG